MYSIRIQRWLIALSAYFLSISAYAAEETLDNPYGLSAVWAQGDWVAKATLLILVLMSMALLTACACSRARWQRCRWRSAWAWARPAPRRRTQHASRPAALLAAHSACCTPLSASLLMQPSQRKLRCSACAGGVHFAANLRVSRPFASPCLCRSRPTNRAARLAPIRVLRSCRTSRSGRSAAGALWRPRTAPGGRRVHRPKMAFRLSVRGACRRLPAAAALRRIALLTALGALR